MSVQQTQRKPSANKNIKKLRTITMVCGLTSGWQKWIQENEKKQASEPSGWAPTDLGGPTVVPRKTWTPKRPPAEASPHDQLVVSPEEAPKTLCPHEDTQDPPKTEGVKASVEPPDPGGPTVVPRKTWSPKIPPAEASPDQVVVSLEEAPKTLGPHEGTQDPPETEGVKASVEPLDPGVPTVVPRKTWTPKRPPAEASTHDQVVVSPEEAPKTLGPHKDTQDPPETEWVEASVEPPDPGGPTVVPRKTWTPKRPPAEASPHDQVVVSPEEAPKTLGPHKDTQDPPETEGVKASVEPLDPGVPTVVPRKTWTPKRPPAEASTHDQVVVSPEEAPKTLGPHKDTQDPPETEWVEASVEPPDPGGPTVVPRKTWTPKRPPAEASPHDQVVVTPAEAPKTLGPHEDTRDPPETEWVEASVEPPVASCIKVKQVVKTVMTGGALDKSAGIGLLTEKITKERLPSEEEEMDRLLKKKSSPTRRRKCSNMVSSLTKSWKQMESEQKLGKEEEGQPGEGSIGGDGGREQDIGQPEAEKERPNAEDAQTQRTSSVKVDNEEDSEEESAVKIKRSTVSMLKNEAKDANQINFLSKKHSAVGNLKSRWQTWASEHTVTQKLNPFSEYFDYDYSMSLRLHKGQEGYGRPKEGTQTAARAKRAEQHIHREIADMCLVIRTMADRDADGRTRVTFGQLFDRYVRISDKVVGILMRARKHGKVAFEGEMLWQGQDDAVIITLLV